MATQAATDECVRLPLLDYFTVVVPLVGIHAACALLFFVGSSTPAVVVFAGTLFAQLIGVSVGYHRLLAHRSFATSRPVQFIFALLGTLAGQNGPLWWVGHHLHHHKCADRDDDIHSPRIGTFWSHMGWLFSPRMHVVRNNARVAQLAQLPEMRLLQRYSYVTFVSHAVAMYSLGELWRIHDPDAGVSGLQLLIWGTVLSTVCQFHLVFCIGSVCHLYGTRPFRTTDDSRNNFILGYLALGEGWHNNHHHCPYSARLGIHWWQLDLGYVVLRLLGFLGIVWDVRLPQRPNR